MRQESGVTILPNDQIAQIETEVRRNKGLTWRLLRFLHQAEPPRRAFVRPTCQVDVSGLARSDAALEALGEVLRRRLRPARMTGAEAEARRAALLDSRVSAGPGRWVAVGLGGVAGLALYVLQPWSLL